MIRIASVIRVVMGNYKVMIFKAIHVNAETFVLTPNTAIF